MATKEAPTQKAKCAPCESKASDIQKPTLPYLNTRLQPRGKAEISENTKSTTFSGKGTVGIRPVKAHY